VGRRVRHLGSWGPVGSVAIAMLVLAVPVQAQQLNPLPTPQAVRGNVIDPDAFAPVVSAEVFLLSGEDRLEATLSNGAGYFLLPVREPGTYRLEVRRLGYQTTRSESFEVESGEVLTVEFRVQRDAIQLEPLVVTARNRRGMNEFLRNMDDWGRGLFLTPEAIDSIAPRHWADVFSGQEDMWLSWRWGVIDPFTGSTGAVPNVRSLRGAGCMVYVVDRTRVTADNSFILAGLSRESIVAVEIYRSPNEIPPHLLWQADNESEASFTNPLSATVFTTLETQMCGVAVYWTRRAW